MKYILFITCFLALTVNSCNKLEGCSLNQSCTEEFRTIYVKIQSQTGVPLLESYSTTRMSDGKLVKDNEGLVWETPTIFSDSEIYETSKEGEKFIFEGYKNGQKVISEEYVIKHDCCHIIKVSGKDTINL